MALSQLIHDLANRAILGEFGIAIQRNQFYLDDHPQIKGLKGNLQYAEMVRLTAKLAPIRLIPKAA